MTEKVEDKKVPAQSKLSASKTVAKKVEKAVEPKEEIKVHSLPELKEAIKAEEKSKVIITPKRNDEPKSINKHKKDKGLPEASLKYPEHVRNIAFLLKNNTEIRRFTSIGILNWLLQKGEIKGERRYVSFLWNKFAVKVDGLVKEYPYTEPFFLNCLVASFTSFSASAQRTIDTFTKKEMMVGISKAVDAQEVLNIVEDTEESTMVIEE